MIWLNVDDAIRIMNTMVVTTSVPSIDLRITRQFSTRKAAASTSTPTTPKAAASDGVAMPIRISPTTQKKTRPSGRMLTAVSRILVAKSVGSTS